jgi:hypothetical protein
MKQLKNKKGDSQQRKNEKGDPQASSSGRDAHLPENNEEQLNRGVPTSF